MSPPLPKIVLFVDDDPLMRSSFARCTRSWPIALRLARDGEEALALASRERPDVVISDLRMPGLNGLELLQEIRRLHPEARLILHTATRPPALPEKIELVEKPVAFDRFRPLLLGS